MPAITSGLFLLADFGGTIVSHHFVRVCAKISTIMALRTVNIRIDSEKVKELDRLAAAQRRNRRLVINEAIDQTSSSANAIAHWLPRLLAAKITAVPIVRDFLAAATALV